jgi:hypothetical protein
MNSIPEPTLAAPGAGLPVPERWIARVLFGFKRRIGSRGSFDARIRRERASIRALVASCDPESAARRVLIRRCAGLEDSSRYWSVWMTLDHLRIVNLAFARIIGALARDTIPPGVASTADVKPSPDATAAVVAAYEESCDRLLETVASVPDLRTRLRFVHPWFGPLDAAGWHALAGAHLGIHRVQIERILQELLSEWRRRLLRSVASRAK